MEDNVGTISRRVALVGGFAAAAGLVNLPAARAGNVPAGHLTADGTPIAAGTAGPVEVTGSNYYDSLVAEIDFSPASSGVFLGSPSVAKLPDGTLVASRDEFGPNVTDQTNIYRSTDGGQSWSFASRTTAFWAKLFVHRGALYLLGDDADHGNVIIKRSDDGCRSWRDSLLLDGTAMHTWPLEPWGYHMAPTPVLRAGGRLYKGIELAYRGPFPSTQALMISADENADLLDPTSWTVSTPIDSVTYLEGNAVQAPNGEIWNIMRRVGVRRAGVARLAPDGTRLEYVRDIDFPGGDVKFHIQQDPKSGRYVAIANLRTDLSRHHRNVLGLVWSENLIDWHVGKIVIQEDDDQSWADATRLYGFQYPDWIFDGDDILIVSRTSYEGADNFHNANRLTFHRLRHYRRYLEPQDLVLHYTFDTPGRPNNSLVVDASLEGNHATATGALLSVGRRGRGLKLNGTQSWIDPHFAVGNEMAVSKAVTFAAWVRKEPGASRDQWVMSTQISQVRGFEVVLTASGAMRVGARSTAQEPLRSRVVGYPDDGHWHHIAVVIDFSGQTMRLYTDGAEQDSAGASVPFFSPTYQRLGSAFEDRIGEPSGGSGTFEGTLDDIRLYVRALTPEDVRGLAAP